MYMRCRYIISQKNKENEIQRRDKITKNIIYKINYKIHIKIKEHAIHKSSLDYIKIKKFKNTCMYKI